MSKLTKAQRTLLEEARRAATMERACFNTIHGPEMISTADIVERTRLYRESWIIGPIDALLAGEEEEWSR